MKEIKDEKELHSYLEQHQLTNIFNDRLKEHAVLCEFEQGERICTQGESARFLYVHVSGKIKVYTTSQDGKILILSFKQPLEIIGDVEYVNGAELLNTVEATSTKVKMIRFDFEWLKKHGNDDAAFLLFLLDIIAHKFYRKSTAMSFNLMYPVEVRLASYLLSVSALKEHTFTDRLDWLDLKDVANFIGTSYRHVNRIIKQFCMEGLIEKNKGVIVIKDRAGLQIMAKDNIYEQ
ncbi:Crp/Fnr family transcriptional regulator [Niallia taxi]|uniref:Crp/Fnr family transcriptional regulator n=1 Tax=Niallia taxi TaxID=2499688 RepID=UPI0015F3B93F|nr:helix-turn-helix domain-containing protein [Niallia taxi]